MSPSVLAPELRTVVSEIGEADLMVETEPPDYVERILLVRPTHRRRRLLAPETATAVTAIADRAREALAEAERRFGEGIATREIAAVRTRGDDVATEDVAEALAGYHFSDDVWARTIYDLIVAAGGDPDGVAEAVDALVPIYFGRVASLVVENRTTDAPAAEEAVERQALEFELRKPYLVERWSEHAEVRTA